MTDYPSLHMIIGGEKISGGGGDFANFGIQRFIR